MFMLIMALLTFLPTNLSAQNSNSADALKTHTAAKKAKSFVHPGIAHTTADFEFVKRKIDTLTISHGKTLMLGFSVRGTADYLGQPTPEHTSNVEFETIPTSALPILLVTDDQPTLTRCCGF